jgi:hypothetical protein
MSLYTDIILAIGPEESAEEEDGRYPLIEELNAWLYETLGQPRGEFKEAPDGVCFVASINFLREDEFLGKVRSMAWEYPECVQVFLRGENDEQFRIYAPAPGRAGEGPSCDACGKSISEDYIEQLVEGDTNTYHIECAPPGAAAMRTVLFP